MKTTIQLLILISILISCKNESEVNAVEINNTEIEKIKIIQRDTFSFNGKFKVNPSVNLKSELKSKLIKLESMENNYKIVKIGKSNIKESIVCHGIQSLPKLSDERQYFEVCNLEEFYDGIEEINVAYIKGTKDIGGKLFPRATVEELIFKSEEQAISLTEFVNQLYIWHDIHKSPNSIFHEENKVYYITSGGWYMKPFYEEIERGMNN